MAMEARRESNEGVMSKYECPICFSFILSPSRCDRCKKLFCGDCLQGHARYNRERCPMRCTNWKIEVPSQDEIYDYYFAEVTCACCSSLYILKNYIEHKEAAKNPLVCCNYLRCKGFSKLAVEGEAVHFCSEECMAFMYFARMQFYLNNDENYATFRKDPAACKSYVSEKLQAAQPKLISEAFSFKQPCLAEVAKLEEKNKVVFNLNSRFYQTVWVDQKLSRKTYCLNVSFAKHACYAKIGVAKRVVSQKNFCFSDHAGSWAFVTSGQTRVGDADCGQKVCEPFPPNQPLAFGLIFDFTAGVAKIMQDESTDFDSFKTVLRFEPNCDDLVIAISVRGKDTVTIN